MLPGEELQEIKDRHSEVPTSNYKGIVVLILKDPQVRIKTFPLRPVKTHRCKRVA